MERTLGPRSVGDLLKETFIIYKNNFLGFAAIVAIMVPIAVLYGIFISTIVTYGELVTETLPPLMVLELILLIPIGLLIFAAVICMVGAVIHAVAQQYLNQTISIGRAYSFAWRRLGAMFGAAFLAYLAIIGIYVAAVILIAVPVALNASNNADVLVAVAMIFMLILIIPAIYYLMINWNFILPTALLEACGSRAALSHSWALVKGSWWRVLGVFLLLYLIMQLIIWALALICYIPALIALFTQNASAFTPYGSPDFHILIMIGVVIFTAIGSILSLPIFTIGQTLLYFDLRVRKQGYTFENLAGELGLPGTAAESEVSPQQ